MSLHLHFVNSRCGCSSTKMNITDIKIRKLLADGRLRAIVSITIDDAIAIHDIKIIEGPTRLFAAMPSRRDDKGIFRDIVHPISAEGRVALEDAVLDAYNRYIAEHEDEIPLPREREEPQMDSSETPQE